MKRYKSGRSPDRLPFIRLGTGRNKKCDCGSGKKAKMCCMSLAETLYHNRMEHINTKVSPKIYVNEELVKEKKDETSTNE